jgi:hypothetical protein
MGNRVVGNRSSDGVDRPHADAVAVIADLDDVHASRELASSPGTGELAAPDVRMPLPVDGVSERNGVSTPREREFVPIKVVSSPRPIADDDGGVEIPVLPLVPGPRVSVIIPTLNEARNLPHVLPAIPADIHEVILVDGRSTDDTVEVARRLLPTVRILEEPKPGKGAALRAGFLAATGDIIVMLDADGSADPAEIPRFVQALVDGADLAKGSRFLPGGGSADITRIRALGNRGFTLLVRMLFGGRYTDLCYGYNAFWRSVGPLLELDVPGFEIETLLNITALRHGLKVTEVASYESARIHGLSNLRAFPDGFRVLRTILRERLTATPARRGRGVPGTDGLGESRGLVAVMLDTQPSLGRETGFLGLPTGDAQQGE